MATLEKIRSKSVLLFVIIIVALLAFILGDFLTSGRTYFGSGTTVAQAAGKKIDFTHYNSELEKASEQMRNYNNNNFDNDELAQNVITNLIGQALLQQEFDDLGLKVSDNEISEAMTGAMPHPAAQQFIYQLSQQLGFDGIDGKAVFDAIQNPAKYNLPLSVQDQLKAAWAQTEKDVEAAMLQQKFYGLVQGLFTANQLDARSIYDDNNVTRHIAFVTKGYNTVANDETEVSDNDIKAYWEDSKNKYRLDEETRAVDYIQVLIEPSTADRVAGQQAVEDAVLALNAAEGLDAVTSDSRFVVNQVAQTASRITDANIREFVVNADNGAAQIVTNTRDNYTIVKRLGAADQVDSINISVIALANAADADSIVAALKAGADWNEYAQTETTQGQDSIWISLVNTTNIDNNLKSAWLNAQIGTPTIYNDSIQGQEFAQVFKVNTRKAPVTVYDFATINFTVDPSIETLEKLNSDLRTFVSANASSEDFTANAAEVGYNVLSTLVTPSSAHIASIPDSRSAVKWAMEAKKGQISPITGDNKQTYLLVLTVKDIYKDGYMPWYSAAVRGDIFNELLSQKKGEKLIADFAGKASDLQGYADAMGTEIAEGDIIFTSPRVATIGFQESAIQGAIASAEEGTLVGPVAGNNAIVVFEVKSVSDEARPFDFDEYAQRFNRTLGLGTVDPFKMLLGKNKIENNSLNFIQGLSN